VSIVLFVVLSAQLSTFSFSVTAAGFEKDTDFTENYECTEEDTLEALVTKIRAYWGWQT
jgi:hypothetical protein